MKLKCRLCLKEVSEYKVKNILHDSSTKLIPSLKKCISILFGINVSVRDKLPKNICLDCINVCKKTQEQRTAFETNQVILKRDFDKNNLPECDIKFASPSRKKNSIKRQTQLKRSPKKPTKKSQECLNKTNVTDVGFNPVVEIIPLEFSVPKEYYQGLKTTYRKSSEAEYNTVLQTPDRKSLDAEYNAVDQICEQLINDLTSISNVNTSKVKMTPKRKRGRPPKSIRATKENNYSNSQMFFNEQNRKRSVNRTVPLFSWNSFVQLYNSKGSIEQKTFECPTCLESLDQQEDLKKHEIWHMIM